MIGKCVRLSHDALRKQTVLILNITNQLTSADYLNIDCSEMNCSPISFVSGNFSRHVALLET
jgi:hypothetical protein